MLSNLNQIEMQVVGECLKATAHGPFFDDCEFYTLIGLSRNELAQIAASWPDVNEEDGNVQLAINNSLLNLTGYPHGRDKEWGSIFQRHRKKWS